MTKPVNEYKWGEGSLIFLDDQRLNPRIKEFMTDVLKESKYDISVIDGARVQEEQYQMFLDGLTEMDGTKILSDHQVEKYPDNLARAIDFVPYVKHLKFVDIWDVSNPTVAMIWGECFRAFLRVDRIWKQKGIDVGLELGWTYNIGSGRDYPHVSFKNL